MVADEGVSVFESVVAVLARLTIIDCVLATKLDPTPLISTYIVPVVMPLARFAVTEYVPRCIAVVGNVIVYPVPFATAELG